jgi:hypothetical protein
LTGERIGAARSRSSKNDDHHHSELFQFCGPISAAASAGSAWRSLGLPRLTNLPAGISISTLDK